MMQHVPFPLHSTFLAIPLEGKAKWLFQALQEELKEWEDILSFQNPQTPHLTLQFWPSVMEIEYGAIVEQSRMIAGNTASFPLRIQGASTFGSRGEDRVLFLQVPFSEELARLRKSCPWPSRLPFSPHITLARIRHPQKFHVVKKIVMKKVADADFAMDIHHLRLYADLNETKQTPLEDFKFMGHY